MKPMHSFAQLLLRFRVREHIRRTGAKPTRNEYFRMRYRADVERRRADARARWERRAAAKWLVREVRKDLAS